MHASSDYKKNKYSFRDKKSILNKTWDINESSNYKECT